MSVSSGIRYAHSLISFKALEDTPGVIEGIASTPTPDRDGDVMDPKGAKFTLPMPLLYQHNPNQPIGQITDAKITKDGIRIRAKVALGLGISWINEAYALMKAGLVPGLSIGFRPNEYQRNPGGGYDIATWDLFEISAVTIPANAQATITSVKSADAACRARSGDSARAARSTPTVVGTGNKDRQMNISERLTTAQSELRTKSTALQALIEKDDLTDEETTERDSLTSEIERLRGQVKSLFVVEQMRSDDASPVTNRKMADPIREDRAHATITVEEEKLPPGISFARMVLCKAAAQYAVMKGEMLTAVQVAKKWYPSSERMQLIVKTAVAAANTTDASWAGPLVYNQTIADFVEYLRPRTIIGQFGQGNIPSMNRVPFNMRQVAETAAMTGYWVGQGAPKPLTKGGYTAQTLGPAKVAAITVDTEELLQFANHPTISAETAMRDGLTRALVAKIDSSLIDPSVAAVSNVSPASLTNGLSLGSSAGNTADDVRTDILSLFQGFIGANLDPRSFVIIMPPAVALSLSLMRTSVGAMEFPDITINGGTLQGIPVIVSNYAALAGYGNLVVGIVASEVNLADDGAVNVDLSREASLEMSDAPTQSGTTGVSLVSLWQNNLVAFRAERYINWGLRRSGVVAAIQSVNWGGVGSPS